MVVRFFYLYTMADPRNTNWEFMAERVADLLRRQFDKQADVGKASGQQEVLKQLLAAQQIANESLQQQVAAQEEQTRALREWQAATQRSFSQTFLRKMALEVPPVVLAVLLAFGINSWWQSSKQEQLTHTARENILREMQVNQATLENNAQRNRNRIDEISVSVEKFSKDPTDTAAIPKLGVEMYALTEAAWEAAGLSGTLPSLDQDFVVAASKIYQIQLTRGNQIQGYIISMTDVATKKPENLLPSVLQNKAILEDMVHNDEFLLRLYNEFLEEYGPAPVAP